MDELVEQMKVVLASAFSLYLKAHYFHWNVEGPNFPQYHEFLGDFYEEVYGSVDTIAEEIRSLNAYSPGSLQRFSSLTKIEDETSIPDPARMIKILYMDNKIIIEELNRARSMAEDNKSYGLVNFLEDRIDKHFKHDWMLRSITKA